MNNLITPKLVIYNMHILLIFQEHQDGHLENRLVQDDFTLILDILSEHVNAVRLLFLLFLGPLFVHVVWLKWNNQAFRLLQIGQME